MAYQLRELAHTRVIGEVKTYKTMEDGLQNINAFWQDFNHSEREEKLIQLADKKIRGFLRISFPQGDRLDYMIAVTSESPSPQFESREIPGGKYLVFEASGPVPDEIQRVTREAYESVIPASEYELRDAPEFELYKAGDPSRPDYVTEIWVPVK